MHFIKQPYSIRVLNLDNKTEVDSPKRHGPLLPNTIRAIICGPSNCGKTNVVISLLESCNGVRFENVYIYSKSLQQPKYRYLEKLLTNIEEIGFFPFSNNCDVIPPSESLPNSVFIFDDVACDKQDVVREYFSMGRHAQVDCFYLCQTYARVPKHLIRDNANVLILFKQDSLNLRHVYDDHVNNDMAYDVFQKLCALCWFKKFGFLVIVKDDPLQVGRYRRGFDEYVVCHTESFS